MSAISDGSDDENASRDVGNDAAFGDRSLDESNSVPVNKRVRYQVESYDAPVQAQQHVDVAQARKDLASVGKFQDVEVNPAMLPLLLPVTYNSDRCEVELNRSDTNHNHLRPSTVMEIVNHIYGHPFDTKHKSHIVRTDDLGDKIDATATYFDSVSALQVAENFFDM